MAARRPKTGELAVIERIRAAAQATLRPRSELRLGIGDDCAILRTRPGEDTVVTTDFSLQGRHFTLDRHPAASIGHRVLARGLSDLAAMGARPLAAFLSLALPRELSRNASWLKEFLAGLTGLAAAARVPLAGGDTSESPSGAGVLADITLLGAVPAGTALRRNTARVGDLIYVTGALGGAAAELQNVLKSRPGARKKAQKDPQTHANPHLFPQPRLRAGTLLCTRATACIDLSDGLSTDLSHLCAASGVAAELDEAAIPLHPLTAEIAPAEALALALHGGEDYELLFTARPSTRIPRTLAGISCTRIGRIVPATRAPAIHITDAAGKRRPLQAAGWEHLR